MIAPHFKLQTVPGLDDKLYGHPSYSYSRVTKGPLSHSPLKTPLSAPQNPNVVISGQTEGSYLVQRIQNNLQTENSKHFHIFMTFGIRFSVLTLYSFQYYR